MLFRSGVTQVMVHTDELAGNADGFLAALRDAGARQEAVEGDLYLFTIP